MGTTAPRDDAASPRTGECAETRSSILAAARRVALREGIQGMSLVSVAREAGRAEKDVSGLFNSKEDLLTSVVAEDLTSLARMMRNTTSAPAKNPNEPDIKTLLITHANAKPAVKSDAALDTTSRATSRFPVIQPRRDQNRQPSQTPTE